MNRDEEIQKNMEEGKTGGEGADEIAYQVVFRTLENPAHKPTVSPGFADRVMVRLEGEARAKRSFLELFLAIFGALSFIAGLTATVVMTDFKPSFGFLSAMSDYKGLFIFGIIFIVLINLCDKKLTRKKVVIE